MNATLCLTTVSILVLLGAGALYWRARLDHPRGKVRLLKVAVGMFGSAFIIWLVYMLASLLQLIVAAVLIGWLTKQLVYGSTLPGFRLLSKQAG